MQDAVWNEQRLPLDQGQAVHEKSDHEAGVARVLLVQHPDGGCVVSDGAGWSGPRGDVGELRDQLRDRVRLTGEGKLDRCPNVVR